MIFLKGALRLTPNAPYLAPNSISRYLNSYTDFGFKKLFGEEGNKDLLTDFLNQLLPPYHQIHSL
ncbi:hypothetical protein THII_3382 [Thioploca ingrica]|uniref:Transposase n=1 Tax=Thioploca ingrica TaxID=40754 RepID=A0A090AJM6_9GAMM|nr:hypothetical protein THII_3382 [Thioploca ingrica]